MRILIVEDSAILRDSLAQGLREAGYAVDAVDDGKRGLIHAQTTDYDVIVLDWMLPELDGVTMLSRYRAWAGQKKIAGGGAAVLMLTAKDSLDDKVRGLTTGADDYLVKPFAFKELLARVQAMTRRRHGERAPVIHVGPLRIDTSAQTARVARAGCGEVALDLTPREYGLLAYLAARSGKPVSRAELEEHLYDDRSQVFSNAIDSAVAALRSKLSAAGCDEIIHTRRKVGYVLKADATGTPGGGP
ncbi:MAG: response regulator transcription factor [Phycisphaerae bacterium]|nr:response regulator transcription factor [Phycisphaerae bacterium]